MRYDPVTDAWSSLSATNAPPNTLEAAWACDRMFAWEHRSHTQGGAYDPVADSWTSMGLAGSVSPRGSSPLVATDHQLLVWGGYAENFTNTGAAYCACAAPPAPGSPGLFLDRLPGATRISWYTVPYPQVTGYDLVRGSLADLRTSRGDFSVATDACLASDQPFTFVDDTDPLPPGGFWYLARARTTSGPGSYDTGRPSQIGSRDAEIAASGAGCP